VQEKLRINLYPEIWQKIAPYSCQLNMDECEDIDRTWQFIATKAGLSVEEVKKAIIPAKDLYIILDHTRTLMMIITDGSLPSNVGGGSNVRNILRRTFAILKNHGWWETLGGIDGFLKIFEYH